MKIVVDTNIVFSAIMNTQGKLGQIIINGSRFFQFYSIALLKDELNNHKNKILRYSGYSEEQYEQILKIILGKIRFVEDILISDEEFRKALKTVMDIDENDAPFIALNNHLNSTLWTGDMKLYRGLKGKGYSRIKSTEEIYKLYLSKELKARLRKG
jgi:predicted nucleic acid-binding protein